MDNRPNRISRVELVSLGTILVLFAVISVIGITWGLPSKKIDKYLFGDDPPWPGEKIYRLAGAGEKFSPTRGADVDVDPLEKEGDEPIDLTATEENVAKIYLRYRLYTYQPDEMITMMALAGMSPRRLQLDPKLYQYGGLFIYPVGALIGACGAIGLVDVRSDVVYYLDRPDEFGRFYIVARAYAALWGLIGAVVVFAIARRLAGPRAGVLSALLFTLLPVVVCMAHEGKPHLPGAVLMLMAVLFAMRYLLRADKSARATRSNWWLMCICCGAAFGMVLSSWPIFVLIPLAALLEWWETGGTTGGTLAGGTGERSSPAESVGAAHPLVVPVKQAFVGVVVAMLVYLVTNPYLVINVFTNREVLRSNFSNSFAMYEMARVIEGFARVMGLTVEGATWPILICGVLALVIASVRKNKAMLPLAVPAVVFFLQFVMIGAGKPAEYGRFGVFTNTALAIGTACLLARHGRRVRDIVKWVPAVLVVAWAAFFGTAYLYNFWADTTEMGSRLRARRASAFGPHLAGTGDSWLESDQQIAVVAQPAPYGCPPFPFHRSRVFLSPDHENAAKRCAEGTFQWVFVQPVDRTKLIEDPEGIASPSGGDREYPWEDREVFADREPPESTGLLARAYRNVHTPISWANKPFEITAAGRRCAP